MELMRFPGHLIQLQHFVSAAGLQGFEVLFNRASAAHSTGAFSEFLEPYRIPCPPSLVSRCYRRAPDARRQDPKLELMIQCRHRDGCWLSHSGALHRKHALLVLMREAEATPRPNECRHHHPLTSDGTGYAHSGGATRSLIASNEQNELVQVTTASKRPGAMYKKHFRSVPRRRTLCLCLWPWDMSWCKARWHERVCCHTHQADIRPPAPVMPPVAAPLLLPSWPV